MDFWRGSPGHHPVNWVVLDKTHLTSVHLACDRGDGSCWGVRERGIPGCASESSHVSASCLISAGPALWALGDGLKHVALKDLSGGGASF